MKRHEVFALGYEVYVYVCGWRELQCGIGLHLMINFIILYAVDYFLN